MNSVHNPASAGGSGQVKLDRNVTLFQGIQVSDQLVPGDNNTGENGASPRNKSIANPDLLLSKED